MNFRSIIIICVCSMSFLFSTRINAQENMKESDQLDFAQGLLSRGMYDMAILQYQKFISDFPHSSSLQDAYLSLGEGYFLSQDFTKAVDAYNQFKQLFPNSDQLPVSILRLAQIDIQLKKFDEAIKELNSIDFQKQLKANMLQSFDYYLAQAYAGREDYASALDFNQKAVGVDGASNYTADAYKEIGKLQVKLGHYSDGLDAYSKSMQIATEFSLKGELAYRIAEAQFLSGKYADAITGFASVIETYPSLEFTQDAVANLLLSYFNLGQYDQLLAEYQKDTKLIKDDETCFSIHLTAVLADIESQKYDQANALLDHLSSFASLSPQEKTKIAIKKADIFIRQKKYKEALSLLEANDVSNSDIADEALFLKAQGYFGLGDYDRSFNFFENVYVNFPKSSFSKAALLGLAHARKEMGRFKEAEVLFAKYYDDQDQPDLKSEALYDGMMMALKADDLVGVISSAQNYVTSYPNGAHYSDVLLTLADTYDKNNQMKEAIGLLQAYLASPSGQQRPNAANFLLGYNQQLLGNYDQALSAYSLVDAHKEEGKFYLAALKNMGIICLNQKKDDQAKVYFDQLINQAGPNDLQLKTYIWVCNQYLKEQKYDDVLRVATQAEKNFPSEDLMEIKYFKAEALRGQGNCDEANKDYNLVISSAQKNVFTGSSHIGYGLCLAKANNLDDAKKEFQKALDDNADDFTITVHARFEMANIEENQGNLDDALKLFMLIATIYDDDHFCSESLLRAGKIAEKLNRRADALKMYSEILEKYKNTTAAEYAKGRLGVSK